jgi:hypothetical protein
VRFELLFCHTRVPREEDGPQHLSLSFPTPAITPA